MKILKVVSVAIVAILAVALLILRMTGLGLINALSEMLDSNHACREF